MMATSRLLPTPDRDSAPYWAALAKGELHVQHCSKCGRWTWPARPLCSGCQAESLKWRRVEGIGEIYTWVVAHRAYTPDVATLVPYTIALVRIDEQNDILIPGRLIGTATPRQGLKVLAALERLTDEVGQLSWTER
jgi:uncharacterized OB-fold protein